MGTALASSTANCSFLASYISLGISFGNEGSAFMASLTSGCSIMSERRAIFCDSVASSEESTSFLLDREAGLELRLRLLLAVGLLVLESFSLHEDGKVSGGSKSADFNSLRKGSEDMFLE